MLTTAATILAALISLLLVVGLLVAMAFFIGVIGYGWVSVLATKEELEAMPPGRRKWVLARLATGPAGVTSGGRCLA